MSEPVRIAVDCDLRKVYAWCSECGEVCKAAPTGQAVLQHLADRHGNSKAIVLFEIASPTSFSRGGKSSGIMFQLAKWAIWNTATATAIDVALQLSWGLHSLRVAPSNIWTRGYELKARHAMAAASNKQKDLRECQTMLWFHAHRPDDWKKLPDYLESL